MADTSPGKVQVLRAMFAQKSEPVMGVMKPGAKMNRPWNRSLSSLSEENDSEDKHRISPVSVTATQAILQAIQTTDLKKQNGSTSHVLCDNPQKVLLKPLLGPKPAFAKPQYRTVSSSALHSSNHSTFIGVRKNNVPHRTCSESNGYGQNRSEIAETVASFMFGESNNFHSSKNNCESARQDQSKVSDYIPSPLSRTTVNGTSSTPNAQVPSTGDKMKPKESPREIGVNSHLSLINSDNYICKSSCNFRRKELPSQDKIGPPPLKPVKPPYMKLPEHLQRRTNVISNFSKTLESVLENKPVLPPKRGDITSPTPKKPSYPCPPRPSMSPPVPPSDPTFSHHVNQSSHDSSQVMKPRSLFEEIEQLYEDTLSENSCNMIPEYTEEEETADFEELYDDAVADSYRPNVHLSHPPKPKYPSPACQSVYLEPTVNGISEEIYHDTDEPVDDEVYEVMPVDEFEECHYSNNSKEIEKLRREEEKKLRKESKEKLKKEKEMEKIKKKFGLQGDEPPIDAGLVKTDSRGNRTDLPVKKGETVYILRIEGNPVGKWLVKNKKGKYGYVELTNIEVDPDSVKSVMTVQRSSVISTSEELYSEAFSEQEGIYEVTY